MRCVSHGDEAAGGMERVIGSLRALGEPTRLRIVGLLALGELTVSELVMVLGQSQPRISRHLKLLAEAGLVERHPEGAWVFYRLADDDDVHTELIAAALGAIPEADATTARDRERLGEVKAARAATAALYFRSVAQDWDRIRALHSCDAEVEAAMGAVVGAGPIDLLIDIGTGTGRMLEVFGGQARRAIGLDLSHEMLTIARANVERAGLRHASVRHGDLYALPLHPGCADLVIIHQVLHYLDDPGRAIGEAARLVRSGGRLVIVDFAPHEHEFLREHHAHRRLGFPDDEVESWLKESGLALSARRSLSPSTAEASGATGLVVTIWMGERALVSTLIDGDAA